MPFFFKQWGGTRKSKAGRILDGQTHDEVPPRGVRPVLDDERRRSLVAELDRPVKVTTHCSDERNKL